VGVGKKTKKNHARVIAKIRAKKKIKKKNSCRILFDILKKIG